uniref:Uncharacterized protein n=1 Tax=Anguilla anguilla TaxID=7936 RepID=A0A0E9UFW9_ANGAN
MVLPLHSLSHCAWLLLPPD